MNSYDEVRKGEEHVLFYRIREKKHGRKKGKARSSKISKLKVNLAGLGRAFSSSRGSTGGSVRRHRKKKTKEKDEKILVNFMR